MIRIAEVYRSLSLKNEVIPFAPYVVTVGSLDDSDPVERALGFDHNKALFESGVVDEVWLFGDRISAGMQVEINWAENLGIKVVDKTKAVC